MIEFRNRMLVESEVGNLYLVIDGVGIRCTSEEYPTHTYYGDLKGGIVKAYDKVPKNKIHLQIMCDEPLTKLIWEEETHKTPTDEDAKSRPRVLVKVEPGDEWEEVTLMGVANDGYFMDMDGMEWPICKKK